MGWFPPIIHISYEFYRITLPPFPQGMEKKGISEARRVQEGIIMEVGI
jgi:hypothetical protein